LLYLWFTLPAGAKPFPVRLITAREPETVQRRYPFAKRASRPVKPVWLAVADVVGFRSSRAFAPYADVLCHRFPLSLQKKVKVLQVGFYYQNPSEPFPHDKLVDHFSIFQEYIGEKAAIAILFFPVKFEANSSIVHQVSVETFGF
jgi:hypothetical protein